MNAGTGRQDTIVGIHLLRAIAAFMVVSLHARLSVPGSESWPAFGYAGVDIFFVISGFVMAHTTRVHPITQDPCQRLTALDFLGKRLLRIVPLYWVALLWTSRRSLANGEVSVDLLKDLAFVPHPNAVYTDVLLPTLTQGWTLNYEMFFYVIFAAAFVAGRRRTLLVLGTLLILACAGGIASMIGASDTSTSVVGIARRFYTQDIILEFGFGMLIQRWTAVTSRAAWPRWVYGAALTAGFALLAYKPVVGPRSIVDGLPAAMIVWASIHAFENWQMPNIVKRLGDASYAIYLFHWSSFGALKPLLAWLGNDANSDMQIAFVMTLHIMIAALSGLAIHIFVEKPLTKAIKFALGFWNRDVTATAVQ